MYAAFSGIVYCWAIGETANAWSPLDAVYFAFISVTSIGLGDIVPASDVFLNVASLAYIIVGLALINLFFSRLIQLAEGHLERLAGTATAAADSASTSSFAGSNQMQTRYTLSASNRSIAGALPNNTMPNYH